MSTLQNLQANRVDQPRATVGGERRRVWDALKTGNPVALKQALDQGCNPNAGYGGWIALGYALRHGTPEMAMVLVEAGANPNATENSKCMLSLAISRPDCVGVAKALIDAGAAYSPEHLRLAARCGNVAVAEHLLDLRVDPVDLGRDRRMGVPALGCWGDQCSDPPQKLIEATYSNPLDDQVAFSLIAPTIKNKRLDRLRQMMALGQVSQKARNRILSAVLRAQWEQGAVLLLDENYCDPSDEDESDVTVLVALGAWLGARGETGQAGWAMLKKLVGYGYSPNTLRKPEFTPRGIKTPVGFLLLQRTSVNGRARLVSELAKLGMKPVHLGRAGEKQSIAAHLLKTGSWDALKTLTAAYPKVEWETHQKKPILHIWADHHKGNGTTVEPITSLEFCLALEGVDPKRLDKRGRTVARILLRANDPNLRNTAFNKTDHTAKELDLLMRRLIEVGVDITSPDAEGIDDITYAQQIMVARPELKGLPEEWLRLALENKTRTSNEDHAKKPARL